jgi:hypothetical protein
VPYDLRVPPPYRLSIDLGTCHTVAVVRRGGEAPRALLFDGSPLLPSGVYAKGPGALFVGRDAERMSLVEPARFEPYPKRLVDEGTALLGDTEVPVATLLAAVLRRVVAEAVQAGVSTAATVLTCPADWGPQRRRVLLAAAHEAGLGAVDLVDEPVAAATYCVGVLGHQVPPGRCLAIFDFGGGTLDVTVVRRDPDGLRVLAVGGLDDLGGVDVDAALVGHLGQLVALRDPELWHRLSQPGTAAGQRDRRAFWSEVRGAKEMLSRATSAPVQVPGRDDAPHLTREELERVAGPLIDRAVDETRRVLDRAGVTGNPADHGRPDQRSAQEPTALLAGIFLVGGSSRIPLVASRLHARFGIAPTVPEQPELPVAYGALLAGAGPAPAPSGPTPMPPAPMSPAPAGGTPTATLAPPGVVSPPLQRTRRVGPTRVVVAVVVAVLGLCAVPAVYSMQKLIGKVPGAVNRTPGIAAGGNGSGDEGELATAGAPIALTGNGAAGVVTAGDTVYYADVAAGHTDVYARPVGGKDPRWKATVPFEPSGVSLITAGNLLVVDGERGHDGKDVRVVFDAASGKALWQADWDERVDVAYLGTDVIVEKLGRPVAVSRVDLLTGKARWNRNGPADASLILDDRRIHAPVLWTAAGGNAPAQRRGSGSGGYAFRESLGVDPSVVIELDEDSGAGNVLDAATGKVRASGPLRFDAEKWTVYDGFAIGQLSSQAAPGRTVLAAHAVGTLTKAFEVPLRAGDTVDAIRPCGPHQVCLAVSPSGGGEQLVSVDLTTHQATTKNEESGYDPNWYVLGGRLVYGDGPFTALTGPYVLDPAGLKAGRTLGGARARDAAVAGNGGRVVMRGVSAALTGEVTFRVWAADLASGATTRRLAVGKEIPKQVTLDGGVLAVVTADHRLLVARVPGGSPPAK